MGLEVIKGVRMSLGVNKHPFEITFVKVVTETSSKGGYYKNPDTEVHLDVSLPVLSIPFFPVNVPTFTKSSGEP